jgi:hypothetical protein
LAGRVDGEGIARALKAKGFARNKSAIYCFAEKHNIDLYRKGKTINEVARDFGFSSKASRSVKTWIEQGFLGTGQRYGAFTVYQVDAIEAFIRSYPWAYDLDRMPPSRLKQLAQAVQTRDPWLSLDEAARQVGCVTETISKRIASGEIDARRRPGYHGRVFVRASSLTALRESIDAAIVRRRMQVWRLASAPPRERRDPGRDCAGCGAPVRAPRRLWCSRRCKVRVWIAQKREQVAA